MPEVPERPRAVAFRTLGCKVNRVESETAAARLLGSGWVVGDPDEADVVVVNTCTVTGEADAKARKEIRRALALPAAPLVVVTGCLAALDPEGLRGLGDRVVVAADRDRVAELVDGVLGQAGGAEEEARDALAPLRPSAGDTAFRTRAMLKVQDGCDAWCAYCIVPAARGLPRSRPLTDILAEAEALAASGVAELVVTGVNVGRYDDSGHDLTDVISSLTSLGPRVRLSSIEPLDLDDRLLGVMAEAAARGAFCPHLHVPLQTGSDRLLAVMGRGYDVAAFADRVDAARGALPGLAVTTDVIAGLPTETVTDADATLAVCRELGFQRLHVFRYSVRSGTRAAGLQQVDARVRAARAAALRELSERLLDARVDGRLGHEAVVLVERPDGTGTTEDHLTVRLDRATADDVSTLVRARLTRGSDGTSRAERLD